MDKNNQAPEQTAKPAADSRPLRILKGLSAVSGIPCRVVLPDQRLFPVWESMKSRADDMKAPLLFTKDMKIFWAVVHTNEDTLLPQCAYLLTGPVSIRPLTEGQLRRFYFDYGLSPGELERPRVTSFITFLDLVDTQDAVLGIDAGREEILKENELPEILLEDSSRREEILFEMAAEREEIDHHSYEEERYLLQCVREGKTQDALRQNAAMDLQMGRMSRKETLQWRKTVTVAITLCSRAAIEGGISPAQAYQISDYYLQKSDGCRTPEELTACRNQAVQELTDLVHARNTGYRTSNYVEKCKDYVRKNYKRKIYIADIANALGISETYLSRIFSRETGEKLQDYIRKVRVEKAANLLIYSDESIADIAEYCCFPSQSYFGQVFLKLKGMSPNRYRDHYKPAEFREKD